MVPAPALYTAPAPKSANRGRGTDTRRQGHRALRCTCTCQRVHGARAGDRRGAKGTLFVEPMAAVSMRLSPHFHREGVHWAFGRLVLCPTLRLACTNSSGTVNDVGTLN